MKNSWSKKASWLSLLFVLSFLFIAVLPVQAAEITDDGTVDEDTKKSIMAVDSVCWQQ